MDKKILVLTHAESCSDVFDKTVDWLLLYSRSGRMNVLSHDWSKKINEGWLPDGNFPIQLPERMDSVHGWFGDSPLTMIGFFTSQDVGSHLLAKDKIKTSSLGSFVYSSPCFCCIQTVKTVLDSWHAEQHIKIRIEPAFANFKAHHDVTGFPGYSTSPYAALSLKTVVDCDYMPVVKAHEWSAEESVEQFYNSCAIHGRFCPFEMSLDRRTGFRINTRCYHVVKFPDDKTYVEMNRRSWHEMGRKLCDQSMPGGRISDFWFEQRSRSEQVVDEPRADDIVKKIDPDLRFLRGIRMLNAVSNEKGEVRVEIKFSNGTTFVTPFDARTGWDANALKYTQHFDTNPRQHICSVVWRQNSKPLFESFLCTDIKAKVDATLCEGFGTDDDICQTFSQSKCVCPDGYAGDLCQDDGDNCVGGPCKNYAACEDYYKRYECICMPGYTGEHCEIDIDECASSPCKNGGTCRQFQDYYNCTCPKDFRGKHCNEAIGKCENVKCENGGTCEEVGDEYKCKCLFGFGGKRCEQVTNLCVSRPCQHEAECEGDAKKFTCKCKPKFTGRLCDNVPKEEEKETKQT
ncbi:EGF-like domain protein [Trichuris suis]|nr:EGF-like domain protein [Trichuris suis]